MKITSRFFWTTAFATPILAFLLTCSVQAASDTWNVNSGDWVESTNWLGGNVPGATTGLVSTDIATFAAGTGSIITVDSYRNVAGLTFNNLESSFTFAEGTIALTPGGTVQILAGANVRVVTINSTIGLGGEGTYTFNSNSNLAGSAMEIGGDISSLASGAAVLTLTGAVNPTGNIVSGSISDGAGIVSVSKTTGSTWQLSNANSYSGGTSIAATGSSKLHVSHGSALGTGNVTIGNSVSGGSYATLQLSGNIALALGASSKFLVPSGAAANGPNIQNLSGTNSISNDVEAGGYLSLLSTSGKLTISGDVYNTYNSGTPGVTTRTFTLAGDGDGELSGRIYRTNNRRFSIVKNGGGTWIISNTGTGDDRNNYQTTTVNAGTLLVNSDNSLVTGATGGITVNETGTFGGSGINGGTAVFNAGSFLSPGAATGETDNLTFLSTVDISLLTSGTGGLIFQLDTLADSDMVTLTSGVLTAGTFDLDDFNFTALGGFGLGDYTLFDTTQTIVGSLGPTTTGVLNGYGVELLFANSNQDIVLRVIPEPSAFALLALAVASVTLARRRR